jgi:hypothetical protein
MPAGASLIGMPVNLKFAVELHDIDACAGFFSAAQKSGRMILPVRLSQKTNHTS